MVPEPSPSFSTRDTQVHFQRIVCTIFKVVGIPEAMRRNTRFGIP